MNNTQTDEANEKLSELILDNLPIGIIYCDNECKIRFMNRAYALYLKVDAKEVVGKPITAYIPESRLPYVLRSGQTELRDDCTIRTSKISKNLIVNRIPVFEKDNKIIGVISQSLFENFSELRELYNKIEHLQRKVSAYNEKMSVALSAKYSIYDIKTENAEINQAKVLLSQYAKTEAPVLLLGATGTGKELFAHALHKESNRSNQPFVSINCTAIPHELLESELFGYVSGAFTGANKSGKVGQIELSDNGTLFLDEIGDMPLHAQSKLLRVLEEKTFHRLGCPHSKKVNFRLIAATNRDLSKLIQEGKFREDLYYRLNTMIIRIPALKEREDDIPILVDYFLMQLGRHDIICSDQAMNILKEYNWPGNVRELKNVVERAVSLCKDNIIGINDLPGEIVHNNSFALGVIAGSSLASTLANNECIIIRTALCDNNWNYAVTARKLGISRATLYEKTKKYGLSRNNRPR